MKRPLMGIALLAGFSCAASRLPEDDETPAVDSFLVLAGSLVPGPHAVGFREETVSLPESTDSPSAVDLYLWYPSREDPSQSRMTLADYYRAQEDDAPSPETLREWLLDAMTAPPGLAADALDSVLASPMWAVPDAPEASGAHPLVLWSYRDSVPTMQTLLNEYLASHGYVVAFAWPVDHEPPFPWEDGLTARQKNEALDVQVSLLDAVLEELLGRPTIDDDAAAMLSWSYGGESAIEILRQRAELRLAIGIDATLVSGWVFRSADELAASDWSTLSSPLALLRNGRPFIGADPSAAPSPLQEIRAGSWFIRFERLSHGNFNFPGGMIPGVLELDEVSRWAVAGSDARLGYELVCGHVLSLLDAVVREKAVASLPDFPTSPDGFVAIEHYPPRD